MPCVRALSDCRQIRWDSAHMRFEPPPAEKQVAASSVWMGMTQFPKIGLSAGEQLDMQVTFQRWPDRRFARFRWLGWPLGAPFTVLAGQSLIGL
jgi:hypothetical protein